MLKNIFTVTLKGILRDRALHALVGVSLFLLLLVPAISSFSMRQMQELSITLCLSCISLLLFVYATLLGASSIWRDIEKKYGISVLSLPSPRGSYVIGKFFAIAAFLSFCAIVMGVVSIPLISYARFAYPSDIPIQWGNIALAIGGDVLKYILLSSLAILFSALSTSFFLPLFGTISIFFAGSASQEVYEYVTGEAGNRIGPLAKSLILGVYYLIPNFGVFNFKTQAIYPVAIDPAGVFYMVVYAVVVTTLALSLATWVFTRREFP